MGRVPSALGYNNGPNYTAKSHFGEAAVADHSLEARNRRKRMHVGLRDQHFRIDLQNVSKSSGILIPNHDRGAHESERN
jgi:hypothetical protein